MVGDMTNVLLQEKLVRKGRKHNLGTTSRDLGDQRPDCNCGNPVVIPRTSEPIASELSELLGSPRHVRRRSMPARLLEPALQGKIANNPITGRFSGCIKIYQTWINSA